MLTDLEFGILVYMNSYEYCGGGGITFQPLLNFVLHLSLYLECFVTFMKDDSALSIIAVRM